MTRTPIDYSKTIIYRIVCKDVNVTECYIGQTTNFIHRKGQHKNNCNNINFIKYNYNYNCYVYQFIRDNMGWNNWDMIEVEKYKAVDSNDAKKRERYWIEFYKANLNQIIPSRTQKEYYEDNKQQLLEKNKEYYEKNKQQILEKHKDYRNQNQPQILEYYKQRYNKNKEQILEKKGEKLICDCGCIIRKDGLLNHQKTKKHLSLIS